MTGGIDKGLDDAGMVCRWQCEIEPYAVKVLEKHWPAVKRYGDITKIDPAELEPVDLICMGFPCTDLSQAGKRKGFHNDDGTPTRSGLFFEGARIIGALRPRWIFAENVPGLLTLPGAAPRVIAEFARLGYVGCWFCLRASDFGASHIRKRVFVVAHRERLDSERWRESGILGEAQGEESSDLRQREWDGDATDDSGDPLAYRPSGGLRECGEPSGGDGLADGRDEELGDAAGSRLPKGLSGQTEAGSWSQELGRRRDALADPGDGQLQEPRRGPQGRAGAGPAGADVSDAIGAGLEIRASERCDDGTRRAATERNRGALPPFAPGPADARWPGIIRDYPWLAPALPGFRRVASRTAPVLYGDPMIERAMSNRTKRLRCLGNSVLPACAHWIGRRILEADSQ